jgi:hypothetical protein
MKTIVVLGLLLCLASPGCAGAKWTDVHLTEIRLRDGVPGTQVRVVVESPELQVVRNAFVRAEKVSRPSDETRQKIWKGCCFDVLGDPDARGRWLIDLESGLITRMDPLNQPVYQLSEDDREAMKALWKKGANQALQTTSVPRSGFGKVPVCGRQRRGV